MKAWWYGLVCERFEIGGQEAKVPGAVRCLYRTGNGSIFRELGEMRVPPAFWGAPHRSQRCRAYDLVSLAHRGLFVCSDNERNALRIVVRAAERLDCARASTFYRAKVGE
jgi:hypothetical protein